MQSKTKSFPIRRFIAASTLLLVGAALCLATSAQAQTVAGYSSQGGQAIANVVSKGVGAAEVTITGVELKSSLSYCLVGVGRGHWHAKKVDGVDHFDLAKIACAKPAGNAVTLTLKPGSAEGSRVIGYVPIAVDAQGKLAEWQPKPAGSQEFERSNGKKDRVIPILWLADGTAKLATAEQALAIND